MSQTIQRDIQEHKNNIPSLSSVSGTELQYLGTTDSRGVDEGEGQAVESEREGRQGEVGLDREVGEDVADTVEAGPNTD